MYKRQTPYGGGNIVIDYGNSTNELYYYGWNPTVALNGNRAAIDGSSAITFTENEKRYTECFVPNSYFISNDFTLKSGGKSISSASIKNIDGSSGETTEPNTKPTDPTTEPTQAAYEGIVIDGSFDDWAAVPKTEMGSVNFSTPVNEVAMVWDGDRIYFYLMIKDDGWNSVAWSGPNGNGKFAITTDLGYTVYVQLGHNLSLIHI